MVESIHAGQYGGYVSPLGEGPLMAPVVVADVLRGHILQGPGDSDRDASLACRHGYITYVWDPGSNDTSIVSAQEDIVAHIVYRTIRGEATIYVTLTGSDEDEVQGSEHCMPDNGQSRMDARKSLYRRETKHISEMDCRTNVTNDDHVVSLQDIWSQQEST
jgi:hypothetical protein